MINGHGKEKDVLLVQVFNNLDPRGRGANVELRPFCLMVLRDSGCRCMRGTTRQNGGRWNGSIDCKEPSSVRRLLGEVGRGEVEANVGWTFARVSWDKVRSFKRDGVRGVGKASERGQRAKELSDGIAEAIAEMCFVGVLAGKDVVAVGVKEFATGAIRVNEIRREDREAELPKQGEAEGVIVQAMGSMLARHAV